MGQGTLFNSMDIPNEKNTDTYTQALTDEIERNNMPIQFNSLFVIKYIGNSDNIHF